MSGYAIFVHNGELIVAHGLDAANQLTQKLSGAILSGEATGVVVRSAQSNALPIVETYNEATFWRDIGTSLLTSDINALARDSLAAMFGIIGATVAVPLGPTSAVLADMLLSELYKRTYDLISQGSSGLVLSFLDYLEENQSVFANNAEGYLLHQNLHTSYLTAASTRPPRGGDPLAIDLDGDGIETVGIGLAPVTFDHNADGLRTGTGWVTGDDAWLVLDRDGNGSIDTGRELFGEDTLKRNGSLATSGLDALRDLDSNLDGQFNSSDAAFAQVKLWRDVNQDGISQSNELFSLADKGIASINLAGTTANTNLGNGNTVGATAVVTRTDGSTTRAFDINAVRNTFYRSFTTDVAVSEAALALPEMGGAGSVRDLCKVFNADEPKVLPIDWAV